MDKANPTRTTYNTVKVDGVDVFYREAGPKDAPVLLLLHGFPTSSHMFKNLIPQLVDKYRVIAPDYPGFGQSGMPDRLKFAYTFDNYAQVVDKLRRPHRFCAGPHRGEGQESHGDHYQPVRMGSRACVEGLGEAGAGEWQDRRLWSVRPADSDPLQPSLARNPNFGWISLG